MPLFYILQPQKTNTKKVLAFFSVIMLVAFMPQKKNRIIFFGDSITQQGVQPGGYVTPIDSMCKLENKSSQFEFIGAGIGGNKGDELYLRMDSDMLIRNPGKVVSDIC